MLAPRNDKHAISFILIHSGEEILEADELLSRWFYVVSSLERMELSFKRRKIKCMH